MNHGWSEVRRVGTDEEAEMIAGFLRGNGITVEIDSRVFHAEPVALGQLGAARVMVTDDHAERAVRLLDELDARTPEDDSSDDS